MSIHRLTYKDRWSGPVYWLLVLYFPAWGLSSAASILVLLCISLNSLFNSDFHLAITMLGACFYPLIIFLGGIILCNIMRENTIEIDNTGLTLRLRLSKGELGSFIPFHHIEKVEVTEADIQNKQENKQENELGAATLKLTLKDKQHIEMNLANFSNTDREQILLSLSLLSPDRAVDESLLRARDKISKENDEKRLLSFTSMWEEELASRFSSSAYMPLYPGQKLLDGRLEVLRQLNLGGWSAVYLCQEDGKRMAVLKESVIPAGARAQLREKALSMFEREAQLLMRIKHPNIVKVYDYFTDNINDRHYILLENLSGENLRKLVQLTGPRHELDVINDALTLCSILEYLHSLSPPMVHRDLTPDNIILDKNEKLILIDFGAANELIGTATGTMVGKQCYIAPEQFRGKACPQSDLYSLGATLAFLLTGEDPTAMKTIDINETYRGTLKIRERLNSLIKTLTALYPQERGTVKQAGGTLLELITAETLS